MNIFMLIIAAVTFAASFSSAEDYHDDQNVVPDQMDAAHCAPRPVFPPSRGPRIMKPIVMQAEETKPEEKTASTLLNTDQDSDEEAYATSAEEEAKAMPGEETARGTEPKAHSGESKPVQVKRCPPKPGLFPCPVCIRAPCPCPKFKIPTDC